MPLPKFYASFPDPSDDWESGPVTTYAPTRPNPEGTVFRNPFVTTQPRTSGEGGANRGYPASTVNAVNASMKAREEADVPAYPTAFRSGYEQGVAGRPAARTPVRDTSPYPGAPVRDVTPASDPYALPRFHSLSNDLGAGESGLFLPGFQAKLAEYQSEADQRFKSGGLVDNWLGRQALKQRSRLVADAERIAGVKLQGRDLQTRRLGANVAALRAQNEVPLAQLSDITQRRGQDFNMTLGRMKDDTDRYGVDTQARTSEENSERALRPHLADVVYGQQMTNALAAGDLDAAEELSIAFGRRNPRVPPDSKFEYSPDGKYITVAGRPGELPKLVPVEDLLKQYKKQAQAAKARELYPDK